MSGEDAKAPDGAASSLVRVGMIGLGFGAEFIPIWQAHPDAEVVAICRRDEAALAACGERFGIAARFTSFEAMLAEESIDVVHINSPIGDHGWMSIAALKAGKNVMR